MATQVQHLREQSKKQREEIVRLRARVAELHASFEAQQEEALDRAAKAQARVAELQVERKEFQEHEHSCGKCGREAAKTKRRMIFDEMRTQCGGCGKWWTTYTKHPCNEPDQRGSRNGTRET